MEHRAQGKGMYLRVSVKEGLEGSSQAGLSDGRPIRERAFGKGMVEEFVVKYLL